MGGGSRETDRSGPGRAKPCGGWKPRRASVSRADNTKLEKRTHTEVPIPEVGAATGGPQAAVLDGHDDRDRRGQVGAEMRRVEGRRVTARGARASRGATASVRGERSEG
jgi:hypothetical protein